MKTTILIAGDFCPHDRVVSFIGKHTIFGNIQKTISKADISVVNMECPVADKSFKKIEKERPHLSCSENAVEELAYAGFKIATLANNHIGDYGHEGIAKSIEACNKFNIKTVGVGINSDQATQTLFVDHKGLTIAIINCCEHEFSAINEFSDGGANPLNPIKQYYAIKEAKSKADIIVVIVHGGIENFQYPTIRMKDTYRFFVDAGADAVVNHHQHCYSGYEIYNGKPIFYGLGNFCFDWLGNNTKTWHEGYMVNLIFEDNKVSFELLPYTQCLNHPEVCLMLDREKIDFEDCINKINEVIKDNLKLNDQIKSFYQKSQFDYRASLEPYSGRILTGLLWRNLLPSLLTRRRCLKLINYIECESHNERMLYFLKSKIYKQ